MKQTIVVGHKHIGFNERAFIIAEAGSNHNQNLDQAKKLIDVAAASGVDAVKFQLFKAEFLYAPGDPAFNIVKDNELPRQWVDTLMGYANKKGVIFLATPFDHEAVDLLDDCGMPVFKIASSEVTNFIFLRYVASKKKPVILSTGMSDMSDVYDAVNVIRQTGNQDIVLLQCSALYPTPVSQVHLRVMDTLREAFHVPVGFSDHTLGILFPAVAVACGACVVEKHFTLDRTLPGPDHSYAIEPGELVQMVRDIRAVEAGLGVSEKKFLPDEKAQTRRESLFAARDMKSGEIFKIEDVVIQRPATGLPVRFLKFVLGQKINRPIKKDDPLAWDMLVG